MPINVVLSSCATLHCTLNLTYSKMYMLMSYCIHHIFFTAETFSKLKCCDIGFEAFVDWNNDCHLLECSFYAPPDIEESAKGGIQVTIFVDLELRSGLTKTTICAFLFSRRIFLRN